MSFDTTERQSRAGFARRRLYRWLNGQSAAARLDALERQRMILHQRLRAVEPGVMVNLVDRAEAARLRRQVEGLKREIETLDAAIAATLADAGAERAAAMRHAAEERARNIPLFAQRRAVRILHVERCIADLAKAIEGAWQAGEDLAAEIATDAAQRRLGYDAFAKRVRPYIDAAVASGGPIRGQPVSPTLGETEAQIIDVLTLAAQGDGGGPGAA